MSRVRRLLRAGGALILLGTPHAAVEAQLRVVDMIPLHFSNENYQNAEPTISVNRVDPRLLVASSYTLGTNYCARRVEAPLYVSHDGGLNWQIICKISIDTSSYLPPGDVIVRWSPTGSRLYVSLLWPYGPPLTMQLFSIDVGHLMDPADLRPMARFYPVDQPDLAVVRSLGAESPLVAANFKTLTMADTLSVWQSGTAAVWQPATSGHVGTVDRPVLVEFRKIQGQNYAIRLAAHASGVVYAAYYSPVDSVHNDLVVVRDDSAGRSTGGRGPFTYLRDVPAGGDTTRCTGHDGLPGIRVARCVPVPFYGDGDSTFGYQRRVSANLSIVVDPRNAGRVFVAWADSTSTRSKYTLHVRLSTDSGQTWSGDLATVGNATNPALAITDSGRVGFLYQRLDTSGPVQRWVTTIRVTRDDFATIDSLVLSRFAANDPHPIIQPYIGDYVELRAVGDTFFGAFSASNDPRQANFPNGVTYLRRVNWATHQLLNQAGVGGKVLVSIDPFFFSLGPKLPKGPAAYR